MLLTSFYEFVKGRKKLAGMDGCLKILDVVGVNEMFVCGMYYLGHTPCRMYTPLY